MKAKTKYRLKVLRYYIPPVLSVLAVATGLGMTFSFAPALLKNQAKLNDYYATDEVYQAAKADLAELDEQYKHGFVNQKEYNSKVEEVKKRVADEYYKDDEDYQGIIKDERKNTACEITGAALAGLGSLALYYLCIYQDANRPKKEDEENTKEPAKEEDKQTEEPPKEEVVKERSVDDILADLNRLLHK